MRHVAKVVLVFCSLPGVESLVWTEAYAAERSRSLLVDAANVDLRPIAPVVVKATGGLPVILRGAGTEVRRPCCANFAKCRKVAGQRSKSAGCTQTKVCQRLGHSVNRAVDWADKLKCVEKVLC